MEFADRVNLSFFRKMTPPDPSAPCVWKTVFARSSPIVLTSPTDASFAVVCSTPPLWHFDAVRGRPPHRFLARTQLLLMAPSSLKGRVAGRYDADSGNDRTGVIGGA